MNNGLSINAYAPVIKQSIDSYHERLSVMSETYTITDGIGFDKASFVLTGPTDYLYNWYISGLVRDVVWKAPDSNIAWHGYVNRLSLVDGETERSRSVDSMANRILLTYTPLDTTANPPTAGAQTTIQKDDTTSQSDYGIKVHVVSANEVTAATADDDACSALKKKKFIKQSIKKSIGAGKATSLKVEMLGYAHMLDWYFYEQIANTGTDDAHNIIIAILLADPNGIAVTTDINIDSNTTAVQKYWDGKQTGWKIIQDIAARGYETGSEGFPWTVGVYEDRRVTYKAQEQLDSNDLPESTNKYLALTHHRIDKSDVYTDESGQQIDWWKIRPDRLVYEAGTPGRPMYVTQVAYNNGKINLVGEESFNPLRERSSREIRQEEIERLRAFFFSKDRDVNVQTNRYITGVGAMEVGIICMWSGSVGSIPTGWALCNGSGGTPDLRGLFIVGAGGSYSVGDTGGSDTVDLRHDHDVDSGTTASDSHSHAWSDTSNAPSGTLTVANQYHPHNVTGGTTAIADAHVHGPGSLNTGAPTAGTEPVGSSSHTHNVSGTTDSDSHSHSSGTLNTDNALSTTQENRPPFYALAFIMYTG